MTDAANAGVPLWLRIVRFPLTRLILLFAMLMLVLVGGQNVMAQLSGRPLAALGAAAAMGIVGVAIYVLFARFVEGRRAGELAPAALPRELGLGLFIGAGLYAACVGILMLLGIYRIDGLNPVAYMLPAAAMALSSGVMEELLFRGALFRIVEEWLGSWISLLLSSFTFGFLHLINPEGTVTGALFISIEAGLLLAAAYMVTRRLWLSIGFHIGWNYTQSGVFSGIVSGSDSDPGLIKATIEGPVALTGGSFGLESSLVAFLLCTATGVIMLVIAVRRGHVVAPSFRARQRLT